MTKAKTVKTEPVSAALNFEDVLYKIVFYEFDVYEDGEGDLEAVNNWLSRLQNPSLKNQVFKWFSNTRKKELKQIKDRKENLLLSAKKKLTQEEWDALISSI